MQSALASVAPEQVKPRRPAECPVETWLGFLGHRWNALVLWHLSAGALRFGELSERLPGVTAKVLSERLGGLARRGLIARDEPAAFPRRVVYRLTEAGSGIVAILDQVELWSRAHGEAA